MNDGKITKHFIACGKNSETALLNTEKHWEHGYFEAIYVDGNNGLSSNQLENLNLNQENDASANIIIIDNDIGAFKKSIEFFNLLNNGDEKIDITTIVIVDSDEAVFDEELNQLHKELEEVTSADYMHLNHCQPLEIESLISMYNHLFCGFSFVCADFEILCETLASGFYFEASKMTVSTLDELPFAVSKAVEQISSCSGERADFKGYCLYVIADNNLPLSVFEACSTMLGDRISCNFIASTNLHEKNKYTIELGAVFNK